MISGLFCTWWAGTPRACSSASASPASRCDVQAATAASTGPGSASRSGRDRAASCAGAPTSAASAAQWASSVQAMATQRSSPAGGVHRVRCVVRVDVAAPDRGAAVDLLVEDGGCQQVQGGLGLRHVHVLAGAGPLGVVEGGDARERREPGRHVVGVGGERPGRGPVGPAGDLEVPGDRRRQVAEPGVLDERTGLAEQRARHHHDAGVDLPRGRRGRSRGAPPCPPSTTPRPGRPTSRGRGRPPVPPAR